MKDGENVKLRAFRAAFPYTLPIFAGFWFIGLPYGIYMNVSGFSFVYPMVMSAVIFGGSLEFVAVSMLLSPFAPLQTLMAALMIQARHLFYGVSMLERFKGLGWMRPYLIFGMCDETFSINYTADIPEDVDRGWFMFFVTLLNQLYWVSGATLARNFGLDADLRHRGHRVRHDGYVRSHLPGTVAEGEKALDGAHRPRRLRSVPRALRRGLLPHSEHALHTFLPLGLPRVD